MHLQLAIVCLFAVGAVTAVRNAGGCASAPCRKHVGIYHITLSFALNSTSYVVITFHPDGTITAIDSSADGNLSATPPEIPNSAFSGAWKCLGADEIKMNTLVFFYRAENFPGAFAPGNGKATFDGKGGISGTIFMTPYDLDSTKNKDRSKWIKIGGTSKFKGEGYKLYDVCDECS